MPGGQAIIPDQSLTSRFVSLDWVSADVVTSETSTSTTYANLTTTGPSVTPTPGVTQDHLISVASQSWFTVSATVEVAIMSPAIAGATPNDIDGMFSRVSSLTNEGARAAAEVFAPAVTNSQTHTAKYRVSAGTGDWDNRRITAVAL